MTTITVAITFHSADAKRRFLQENGFTAAEIIQETAGSITIQDDGMKWEMNGWVYSVKR